MTDIFHDKKAQGNLNPNAGYTGNTNTGNEQNNPDVPRDINTEFYSGTTRVSNPGGTVQQNQTEYSHVRGGTGRNVSVDKTQQITTNSNIRDDNDSRDKSGGGFLNQAISAITGQSGNSEGSQLGTGRGSQAETPGSWKTGDTSTKSFISERGVIDEKPRGGTSLSESNIDDNIHVPGTKGSQPRSGNNPNSNYQDKRSAAESGVGTGVHIPGTADQRYYESTDKPQNLGHASSEHGRQSTKEKLSERSKSSDQPSQNREGLVGVGATTGAAAAAAAAAASSRRDNGRNDVNNSDLRNDHRQGISTGSKEDQRHDTKSHDSKKDHHHDDKESKSGGFLGIGRRLSNTFKHSDNKEKDASTRDTEPHVHHSGHDSSSSSVKHTHNEAFVGGQPSQTQSHEHSNEQRRSSAGSGSFKGLGKFLRKEKNSPPQSPQKGTTFEEQKRLHNTHGSNRGVESATRGVAGVSINDSHDNRNTHDTAHLRQTKLDSDPTVVYPKGNEEKTSPAGVNTGGNQTIPAGHSVDNSRVGGGQNTKVVEEEVIISSSGYQNDQPTHDLEGKYAMGDYHGNRNTSRPIPKDAPEHVKNSTLDPENQEHDKSGIKKLIDKIKH
ncbi:BA75_03128T0 [Komagataella pastoris]|uniref:BA75_03128T0 n=1 Tax=Komagataella pastoris TaxID=4922 RepID=A0A1B2JCR5_PICPA|nr:BA75_03128T0 [Komagataella pastoris]